MMWDHDDVQCRNKRDMRALKKMLVVLTTINMRLSILRMILMIAYAPGDY